MTNPEMKLMLELAAKACGDSQWSANWNPYLDDGDYSRMEAQLDIDTAWGEHSVTVKVYDCGWIEEFADYSDHNNDKQAARRAAGTRLAAEIGRMK